jgi:hypothetical protein
LQLHRRCSHSQAKGRNLNGTLSTSKWPDADNRRTSCGHDGQRYQNDAPGQTWSIDKPSRKGGRVGISFDGSAAATPIKCELLTTGTVGATITEFVAADIISLDPNTAAVTDDFPFAFTASGDESGYTATAEGSIVATRIMDVQLIAPTNQYIKQFPLGREPMFKASEFLRVRVTAGTAVNAYCYVVIEI